MGPEKRHVPSERHAVVSAGQDAVPDQRGVRGARHGPHHHTQHAYGGTYGADRVGNRVCGVFDEVYVLLSSWREIVVVEYESTVTK